MVTNLFDQRPDVSPIPDPYGSGGLRVWDDYQFRRKGRKGGGGGPGGPVEPPVILYPPVNVMVPTIVGAPTEDVTAFCNRGTWDGTVPIAYDYEWHRVSPDVGPGVPPSIVTSPSVSGSTTRGATLHTSTGSWAGSTPITYSYQWKRLPSTLVGGNSSNYVTVPADVGFNITCTVTATNSSGTASQPASNSRGPIVEPAPGEPLTDDLGEVLTDDFGEELTS